MFILTIGLFIESIKHIAIITPGFPENELDTVCIPALQLYVEALIMNGYTITVFALHYPFSKKMYSWKGCMVIPLNGANSNVKRKLLLRRKLHKTFNKVHEKSCVDLIHCFWLNEATLFAHSLSLKHQLPLVATAMGQDVLDENKYKIRILELNIQMVLLSEFQAKFIGQNQHHIIPWGIKSPNVSTKENDLIFIGNLTSLKNPTYFLMLCNELINIGLNLTCVMVGNGPEFIACEKYIVRNGLNNVQLLGNCSYEKTQELLSTSKLLIHCSSYESFGMIFIEALANQVHVITNPVGFAYNNPHFYTLTFDLSQDTKTIIQLLEMPVPEMKIYSIETTFQAYQKLYQKTIENHNI